MISLQMTVPLVEVGESSCAPWNPYHAQGNAFLYFQAYAWFHCYVKVISKFIHCKSMMHVTG